MCLLTSPGCSSQDDYFDIADSTVDTQTCQLILTASKVDFDVENQSRSTSSWENGDKIYLTFEVSTGNAYGTATYDNGIWNFDYHGQLKKNILSKCSAVYFDQQLEEKSSEITLNETVAIFQDIDASYIYKDGNLYVTASLTPKTGRIRFQSDFNHDIAVQGISYYTSYNIETGEFVSTNKVLKTQINPKSGYTPYIYGLFNNSTEPRIILFDESAVFTRKCSLDIFHVGQSGYMVVPSESALQGWENGALFHINGVDFKMIQIKYGKEACYLGETEVTEALYNAVNELTPTNSQLPKEGFHNGGYSSNDNYHFFDNLTNITGLSFRHPTLSEWTYAYLGGDKSLDYTYSGSNSISEVAWYYGNSESTVHPVKQLNPNELGFYDMCGNLSEPVITNARAWNAYQCYGGNYLSSPSECLSTSSTYVEGHCGCRLAFSIYYSL